LQPNNSYKTKEFTPASLRAILQTVDHN